MHEPRVKQLALLALALLLAPLVASCATTGRTRTQSETIELGGAQTVNVDINMAVGRLLINRTTSSALLEAEFSYNVTEWEPEISYAVSGESGSLRITQPTEPRLRTGRVTNTWSLDFNERVPLDINLRLGAGEADMDLEDLNLRSFQMEAGAGDVVMDLSADWEQDLPVSIEGGVGRLELQLPTDVGVYVTVSGGLGSVTAPDLGREGDAYVNDAYGQAPVTLTVQIDAGIGEVVLKLED